jgi:two-component system chemotaxis sensor kinase CheA
VSERALTKLTGAMTALSETERVLEHVAADLRDTTQAMDRARVETRRELALAQKTTLKNLFNRLRGLTLREAERLGLLVEFEVSGDDIAIDRRVVDVLAEPLMHITRNSIAHGASPASEREEKGKAPHTTIRIDVAKRGARLILAVSDDGRGVDRKRLAKKARELGLSRAGLGPESPRLLDLLFAPGFSTSETTDELKGRGLGLDIVRVAVQRLGGSLRLKSELGQGLSVELDIPQEPGSIPVLWVRAGTEMYGFVSAAVAQVTSRDAPRTGAPPISLSACLDGRAEPSRRGVRIFDLSEDPESAYELGVDDIGTVERVLLRSLPPRAHRFGPFVGAALSAHGDLRLVLDHIAVLSRARQLTGAAYASA